MIHSVTTTAIPVAWHIAWSRPCFTGALVYTADITTSRFVPLLVATVLHGPRLPWLEAAGAHPHQHARALLAGGGHLRPARAPQGAVVRLGDLTHRTEGSTVATEAG